jgi:hypothetical protein
MGATPVHEGKAHALLAARRAPVPRRGESLANAKWPLSMRRRSGLTKPLSVTRRWGKRPRHLSPGRAHAKAWTPPPKTGAGDATGASEVGRIGRAGKNTPSTVTETPNGVDAARQSEGTGHVMASFPGHAAGPKTRRFHSARKCRGCTGSLASTGTRSREFGKQTSVGRIVECLGGEALQGAASRKPGA